MGALLTQFMNKYAYTDFHELNADWMIRTMMELINQVENFVSLNAIKYADPIQWNITKQYEKNTVVIDPLTGTAYISVQPVPMGVALTNTNYWTVVFDLGSFVVKAAKNFTNRYEADTTLTATFPSAVGDWLVWGDTLYEVISTIIAGDQYVENSNIRHITMEEVADALSQAINAVDTKVGDLNDLTTSDNTSIVNAINNIVSTIGDLSTLTTADNSDVVSAINSIITRLNHFNVYNIADYGMQPGTNIYDALYDLLHDVVNPAGGGIVYFPKGKYIIDYTIFIPSNTIFMGEGVESNLFFDLTDMYSGSTICTAGENIGIINMSFNIDDNSPYNTTGSLPNTVGISDMNFNGLTGKRVHEEPRRSGCKNILLQNVYSLDSNYGLQIEPQTYALSDIVINNFQSPTAMFSISPIDGFESINNVYIKNVICDTLRIASTGAQAVSNLVINDIYCTQMKLKSRNVTVDGFYLHSEQGNRITGAYEETIAIVLYGDNIRLANGKIDRDASSPAVKVIESNGDAVTGNGRYYLSNIHVDDISAFTGGVKINTPYKSSFYYENCNFDPYAAYEGLTNYSNFTSHWPVQVVYNCNVNCSRISATLEYLGGALQDSDIATIGTTIQGTDIEKEVYCKGYLFEANNPAAIEPCTVKLDPTDHKLYVLRLASGANSYNGIAFDLIW